MDKRNPTKIITLPDFIKSRVAEPLSFQQVREILGNAIYQIVIYDELQNCDKIENIVKNGIVLYLPVNSENSGHYVSMWLKSDTLYYFDPYGLTINRDLFKATWIKEHGEARYLNNLLTDFVHRGGKISMNNMDYELDNNNVSTCGRWSAVRLHFKNLDHYQFMKFLKFGMMKPDDLISLMTWFV